MTATTLRFSASILAADFACLGDEVRGVLNAGCDYIHFDVMDFHFVPNLSFGPVICTALRKAGITAPIDVHLMVENPERYIAPFRDAGADLIVFHPETAQNPAALIEEIHKAGMQAGIAINPDVPLPSDEMDLNQLQMILLMSVNPGFGGQAFMPTTLDKLSQLRSRLTKQAAKTWIGIDGGVKLNNLPTIHAAGADFFVVGSGLFEANNYEERMQQLRAAVD